MNYIFYGLVVYKGTRSPTTNIITNIIVTYIYSNNKE